MLCSGFSYRAAGSRSAKTGISAFRKHKKKKKKKKKGGLGEPLATQHTSPRHAATCCKQ